jgi:hypothetical protein
MMTPSRLAERISCLIGDGYVDERPDVVIFHSPLAETIDRDYWLNLRQSPPSFLRAIHIIDAESDGELQAGALTVVGESFRITIQKATVPGELRLLFSRSIVGMGEALALANCIQVGEMAAEETFATYYARFQPWTVDEAATYAPSEPLADPRNFVKDFTGSTSVSADPRPWLLRTAPITLGACYVAWRGLAARRLMAILSDQVSVHDRTLVYNFAGPPSQVVTLSDEQANLLADGLQAGASWVLTEGKDADTRHLLFANEWARAYGTEQLQNVCGRSLESARAAYSAYVKAGSRETLKALADLRKAVIDESQKASQRAQDLAGALWKDVAVAAAPFVLKILADSAKIENSLIAGGMALAAAVFLLFSFGMQIYINHRYFKHQDDSRVLWWQVLNNVLAKDDVERFSEQPVLESVKDYKRVRLWVGLFYVALITVLIIFGTINLTQKMPSTTPNQTQKTLLSKPGAPEAADSKPTIAPSVEIPK